MGESVLQSSAMTTGGPDLLSDSSTAVIVVSKCLGLDTLQRAELLALVLAACQDLGFTQIIFTSRGWDQSLFSFYRTGTKVSIMLY